MSTPRIVVICGATASRKSEVAVGLAERRGGEVICADSVQIYEGLVIGSAAPGPQERARVPHHLYGVIHPHDAADAGRYARLADEAIAQVAGRGALPIVVGGAGIYLRSLLWGLAKVPEVPAEIRDRLAREHADQGNEALFRRLVEVDPAVAERIEGGAANTQRVLRALEVYEGTGERLSDLQAAHTPRLRYDVQLLAPEFPSDVLRRRIERRVDGMFEAGLVAEVRGLLDAGIEPGCRAMGSLGYREVVALLRGEIEEDEARRLIVRGHRRYAKRQRTWFRQTPFVRRLDGEAPDLLDRAEVALETSPAPAGALPRRGQV